MGASLTEIESMYVKSIFPIVEKINAIPFLGGFILTIFSALPGALLAVIDVYAYHIEDNIFPFIAFPSFVIWNLFLNKIGIKIYLFLIPAWIFWIIVSILVLVFKL